MDDPIRVDHGHQNNQVVEKQLLLYTLAWPILGEYAEEGVHDLGADDLGRVLPGHKNKSLPLILPLGALPDFHNGDDILADARHVLQYLVVQLVVWGLLLLVTGDVDLDLAVRAPLCSIPLLLGFLLWLHLEACADVIYYSGVGVGAAHRQ